MPRTVSLKGCFKKKYSLSKHIPEYFEMIQGP